MHVCERYRYGCLIRLIFIYLFIFSLLFFCQFLLPLCLQPHHPQPPPHPPSLQPKKVSEQRLEGAEWRASGCLSHWVWVSWCAGLAEACPFPKADLCWQLTFLRVEKSIYKWCKKNTHTLLLTNCGIALGANYLWIERNSTIQSTVLRQTSKKPLCSFLNSFQCLTSVIASMGIMQYAW